MENVAADQMLTVAEEVPSGFLRSNFYADQTTASGSTSTSVQFMDASLVDAGMPIVSWEWDFDNDGAVDATVPNPTWTYAAQNDTSFSVGLTVFNGRLAQFLPLSNWTRTTPTRSTPRRRLATRSHGPLT